MGIGNEPGAVREPEGALPSNILILEFLRQRNGASLAGFNELDVHPLHIAISQVFAVGRNHPAGHPVLKGIDSEFSKLQLWWRLLGGRSESAEPERCASDEHRSD